MTAWLKSLLRSFLGLDKDRSVAISLWKAHEKLERERHKEVKASLDALLAGLQDLRKRLEVAHTFEPLKLKQGSYDWEQVQALQLQRAIDEDANRKDEDA